MTNMMIKYKVLLLLTKLSQKNIISKNKIYSVLKYNSILLISIRLLGLRQNKTKTDREI